MRAILTLSVLIALGTMIDARGQNVAIQGCGGTPQTWNVTVDADQNGKLVYRDDAGNDATSLHVCPDDEVNWTGKLDDDVLTISFTKADGQYTPADDGLLVTARQHSIHKHIKHEHARLRYPYSVTLGRNGSQMVDDPLIIIGH